MKKTLTCLLVSCLTAGQATLADTLDFRQYTSPVKTQVTKSGNVYNLSWTALVQPNKTSNMLQLAYPDIDTSTTFAYYQSVVAPVNQPVIYYTSIKLGNATNYYETIGGFSKGVSQQTPTPACPLGVSSYCFPANDSGVFYPLVQGNKGQDTIVVTGYGINQVNMQIFGNDGDDVLDARQVVRQPWPAAGSGAPKTVQPYGTLTGGNGNDVLLAGSNYSFLGGTGSNFVYLDSWPVQQNLEVLPTRRGDMGKGSTNNTLAIGGTLPTFRDELLSYGYWGPIANFTVNNTRICTPEVGGLRISMAKASVDQNSNPAAIFTKVQPFTPYPGKYWQTGVVTFDGVGSKDLYNKLIEQGWTKTDGTVIVTKQNNVYTTGPAYLLTSPPSAYCPLP
jgi:hypothetical protein